MTDWAQTYRDLMDAEMRKRTPRREPVDPFPHGFNAFHDASLAAHVRKQGPLTSWRMPEWDDRESYYDDGTILRAEDVPIYRPHTGALPPYDGISELPSIRTWVRGVAPYYHLSWVPIRQLCRFRREYPHEVAWIELFVDLIRRGSEPPPIICDWPGGVVLNGSVRTCALLELGRESVHAWVADRDYNPSEVADG